MLIVRRVLSLLFIILWRDVLARTCKHKRVSNKIFYTLICVFFFFKTIDSLRYIGNKIFQMAQQTKFRPWTKKKRQHEKWARRNKRFEHWKINGLRRHRTLPIFCFVFASLNKIHWCTKSCSIRTLLLAS